MKWLVIACMILGVSVVTLDTPAGGTPRRTERVPVLCPLPPAPAGMERAADMDPIEKNEAEWRKQLTPEQYHVTREQGTESAFTGLYWNHKQPGVYRCVACGLELYRSDTKYDSGTGWPSFWAPIDERRLRYEADIGYGMRRVEVRCARCGSHLGHVFDDGPKPTGQRHCINSAALTFTLQQP
jgi:peptide-methionine (R)-S-oxide reductase